MRILATAATLLALTACGGPVPTVDASPPPTPTSTPSPTAWTRSPTPTPPPTPTGPTTNRRGNLEAALGETAILTNADGSTLVTWSIDEIDSDLKCTEEYHTKTAENGNLIGVKLTLETHDLQESYFSLSPYDWSYIGPDGITLTDLGTIATYGCVSDGEEMHTGELQPGQKYVGTVVLDVTTDTGTLVFEPSSINPESGWEVKF